MFTGLSIIFPISALGDVRPLGYGEIVLFAVLLA